MADLRGTGAADSITGGPAADRLWGLGGHDRLYGGAGTDELYGGEGSDTLFGGAGRDTLNGGNGSDTLYALDAGDVIRDTGTSGVDTVLTSLTSIVLGKGIENLELSDYVGARAEGNAAANTISGSLERDTLYGGGGDDVLRGRAGSDFLYGGDGDDTVSAEDFSKSSLYGGAGRDTLYGSSDGPGLLLSGGSGDDTYVGLGAADRLVEQAGGGRDLIRWSGGALVLPDHVEDLVVEFGGRGTITGNIEANHIQGSDGNDTFKGGDGNDTLQGGAGVDWLAGGPGDDLYRLEDRLGSFDSVTVAENADRGVDTVVVGRTFLLPQHVEHLTLRDTARDATATGNGSANVIRYEGLDGTLFGLAGADSLFGGSGNDWLDGGDAADWMEGREGSDTYVVTSASDRVREAGSGDLDEVRSSVAWVLGSGLEVLTLTGGSGIAGSGNDLDNVITGNDRSNTLKGGLGRDTLDGGDGSDRLEGGKGDDLLIGNLGSDVLDGGDGRDTLYGGSGSNTLTGGDGADTFRFSGGPTVVTDFRSGQDTLGFLDDAVGGPGTTSEDVLDHARLQGGAAVFDFGHGAVLTVRGVADLDALASSIDVYS